MAFELRPCDIILTHGGSFVSRAIRWAESRPGHPAYANHAALCLDGGDWSGALIGEALSRVQTHSPASQYAGSTTQLRVWRPLDLTDQQRQAIIGAALRQVGQGYDYLKIGLQAIDGLLGKLFRREVVLARRLGSGDWGPICSWYVAEAYDAAGLTFGMPPRAADPDDLDSYCAAHPVKYGLAWDWAPIPRGAA